MDSLFKLYNLWIQLDDISPLLFELFFWEIGWIFILWNLANMLLIN